MAKRKLTRPAATKRPGKARSRPPGRAVPGAANQPAAQWIYGVHAALSAIANPRRACRRVVVARAALPGLASRLDRARAAGAPSPEIEILDRIEPLLPAGAVHQGLAVLAVALPETTLEDVCRAARGQAAATLVALDQATDPQNVGAVLRSAAAFGARAVIVPARHSPQVTGALAKAASGALEAVPLVRVANLARALDALKGEGFWCIGLAADAPQTLAEARLSGRLALILGAEGRGLRRLTRERCDVLVRVPVGGGMESLNLSVAAAIALYELRRVGANA